ncbi:hypothetical protein [Paenibacillus azoreducens]|uniref:Preprotein translocase subunit Tim44 n=1 Tax=Paenibacillus azoreducens TaxID=116718 RepID=A0A919Y9I1_9BACL|nr:hypothetical protein [Paenibacillus azoreducens]GIO46304.1 hypothetical protein J34TS1_10690 [Paenibacillus azoreducens]
MTNKSLKKWIMIVMAFTLFFAVSIPADNADARRGGGSSFRSGTKSYTNTPKKSPTTDNVRKSTNTNHSSTAGTPAKRGFFSGGGFFKGLMIGGLAGMLFGGLFSNMGFLGNIFGLLINLLAIYVLISIAIAAVRAFRNRRKPDPRDGRY